MNETDGRRAGGLLSQGLSSSPVEVTGPIEEWAISGRHLEPTSRGREISREIAPRSPTSRARTCTPRGPPRLMNHNVHQGIIEKIQSAVILSSIIRHYFIIY